MSWPEAGRLYCVSGLTDRGRWAHISPPAVGHQAAVTVNGQSTHIIPSDWSAIRTLSNCLIWGCRKPPGSAFVQNYIFCDFSSSVLAFVRLPTLWHLVTLKLAIWYGSPASGRIEISYFISKLQPAGASSTRRRRALAWDFFSQINWDHSFFKVDSMHFISRD